MLKILASIYFKSTLLFCLIFLGFNYSANATHLAGGKIVQEGTYIWKVEFKGSDDDDTNVSKGPVNL